MSKWKIWCSAKSIPAENGPCAWGAIIESPDRHQETHYRFISDQGNTLMADLIAATESLQCIPDSDEVIFYSRSEQIIKGLDTFVSNWMRRNWKTKNGTDVLYKDLWMNLYDQYKSKKVRLKWIHGNNDQESMLEKADFFILKKMNEGRWIDS